MPDSLPGLEEPPESKQASASNIASSGGVWTNKWAIIIIIKITQG